MVGKFQRGNHSTVYASQGGRNIPSIPNRKEKKFMNFPNVIIGKRFVWLMFVKRPSTCQCSTLRVAATAGKVKCV